MPLFMDIHRRVANPSPEWVRRAHVSDLEAQERHGVKYIKYWFDPSRATICCLIEAPDRTAGQACHREAHGSEADEVIEVETGLLESFLGGPTDDVGAALLRDGRQDTAFRTIMFTDIEGSTAMTERLGDAAAVEVVGIHDRITRDALSRHDGREVKHTGDGLMAAFVEASRAVACAIDLQRAFAAHAEHRPAEAIRIRIGLSAGEPVAANHDLYGVTVNLARRVCDAAPAGEIMVSGVIRDLCAGKGFTFEDRGESALKGFSETIRLFRLVS
jgi:class 3 adenylate cyclase